MAVDTEAKRLQAIATWSLYFFGPIPDSTISQIDRSLIQKHYYESEEIELLGIDRYGIVNMLRLLFVADTGTLYGSGKYLQDITINPVHFDRTRVDIKTPYRMAMLCRLRNDDYFQLQNKFETYDVDIAILGLTSNPKTAYQNIDDAMHRIAYLVDNQMYSGDLFTSYYNDSVATVVDAECDLSSVDITLESGIIKAECDAAITVLVNRLSS